MKSIRQYQIFYRRANAPAFTQLQPIVDSPIYDKPEVTEAIDLIREKPYLTGICVQISNALFNIVSFSQPAIAPKSFEF